MGSKATEARKAQRRRSKSRDPVERNRALLAEQERLLAAKAALDAVEPESPDDSRFRPTAPDKLRTGPARVTNLTARAAAAKNAMRKYDYDQLTDGALNGRCDA